MAVKKITTTTGNADPVMQVRTHASLSAEDLEAEIASAASAIGGGKTVDGTHIPKHKVEKTKKPAKKAKAKKATKAKTTKKVVTGSTNEEAPAPAKKTTVKVRQKSDESEQVEDKPTIELKKSSTIIESAPAPVTPKASVPSAAPHHEKVIKPISSATKIERAPAAVPTATLAPATTPKTISVATEAEESKPEGPVKEQPKPVQLNVTSAPQKTTINPIPTTKTVLSKPIPKKNATIGSRVVGMDIAPAKRSPQLIKRVEQLKVQSEESIEQIESQPQEKPVQSTVARNVRHGHKTPHVARIYDTTTYHMPLEVNHHHRKISSPRWVQYIVLAIGVASLIALAFYKGYIG